MKNFRYIFLIALIASSAVGIDAQNSRTNQLFRPCPNSTTPASVRISPAGSITLTPCPGQTVSPSGTFTVGSGASSQIKISETFAPTNFGAIWFGQSTPSSTNYSFAASSTVNGGQTIIRSGAYTDIYAGANLYFRAQDAAGVVGVGLGYYTNPVANVNVSFGTATALYTGWRLKLSGSQAKNAYEVRDSSDALLSGADQLGRVFGVNGAAVASAATISISGNVQHITGTTNITSVSGTGVNAGTCSTLIFDGVLTFTDGSNLKLAGNFVTTADDTITICYDGTNWYETARAVN